MRFIPFILFLFLASTSYGQQTTTQEEKDVVRIDTIITFDPETFEETIELVVYKGELRLAKDVVDFAEKATEKNGVDTIIIFDPKTMKEDTVIVKRGLKE